jgi:hypothetical protein
MITHIPNERTKYVVVKSILTHGLFGKIYEFTGTSEKSVSYLDKDGKTGWIFKKSVAAYCSTYEECQKLAEYNKKCISEINDLLATQERNAQILYWD